MATSIITGTSISGSLTGTGSFDKIQVKNSVGQAVNITQNAGDVALYAISPSENIAKFESSDGTAAIVIEDNSSTGNANRVQVVGDVMELVAANSKRVELSSGNIVFNQDSDDVNFRIESNNDQHMLSIDGGKDKIAIGSDIFGDDKMLVAGNLGVTGSLHVSGNITTSGSIIAKEFRTEFVNQIIATSSGSTTFGDGLDDVHRFTGSVNITGSLTIPTGSLDVRGGVGGTDIATFARNVGATADIGIHAGSGDPQMTFTTPSRNFSIGASAGGHEFRISEHTAIGTNNRLIVRDDGDVFISQSLDFRAEHAADKIVLYNGGNEKIGTAAHTMILTATSHSFKDTDGHENFKIGPTGDVELLATGRLFLDGGSGTYIHELSDNVMEFRTDNNPQLKISNTEGVVVNDGSYSSFDFRVESNNHANMLFVDAGNDNIAIGNTTADATLHIGDSSTGIFTLGTVSGSTIDLFKLEADLTNAGQLIHRFEREATGSDWTTAGLKILARTDVTEQAWIKFNGAGNNYGVFIMMMMIYPMY